MIIFSNLGLQTSRWRPIIKFEIQFMGLLRLAGECVLISMAFNLIGNEGVKLDRIGTSMYWLWTVALAFAIGFAAIIVHIRQGILVAHWLDRYPQLNLIKGDRLNTSQLPLKDRIWAIMSTAMLIQFPYIFFIFLISFVRQADTFELFRSYMIHYMPWLSVACVGYVSYIFTKGKLWWLRPEMITVIAGKRVDGTPMFKTQYIYNYMFVPVEKVVEREVKIVPPNVLDEKIVIGSLYDVLYHHSKFETDFKDKDAVRMFDVPFYFSSKGKKEILLVDGTRKQADCFMDELEERGLDKWYFRISSTCRINMMHIRYPVKSNTGQFELHKEVANGLRTRLTAMEISNLLLITEWIRKGKKLAKFLDNVAELRHEGWDDFIPLN